MKETSLPAMETHTKNHRPTNGQLISVPHKDTIRLLEVYVKRSLSLNDGSLGHNKTGRKEKWVTKPNRQRRHSSDPSLSLAEGLKDEDIATFTEVEPPPNHSATLHEESEKPTRKSKKNKKTSFWKSLFGVFNRKSNDEKSEEEDGPSEIPEVSHAEEASETPIMCLPTTPATLQKRKSTRRKSIKRSLSKKRISVIRPHKHSKDLNPTDITRVEAIVSVEPTYSYYEKVSEELEKIVHELQEKEEVELLSDEEVINRIIALTKEQGDAIDDKLRDNPTLSSFFQRMSYSSFQKLADAYVGKEVSPIHDPPTVLPTAPELVKLAFTYDFTAKIARLSKQNVGHITGLGNRYLQDRFEYTQACTDHPVSDSDS
uniref:uncharacterized protein LOC124056025 n=1 Tax=Scatophagus argus TaxID=75038 RepID=UPI001ED80CA2|nr:uncharacterized protein LOC124056025 [Scatophagus argus]